MTPTPEQAKAELERRKSNKALKQRGEPKITVPVSELTKAQSEQLREWAKD